MATSKTAQLTDFTQDVLGRHTCNGFDEAMHSMDKNGQRPDGSPQSDARPFNAIIIGGGSFDGVLAQHLLYADKTNSYRILVLEGGQHSLPKHPESSRAAATYAEVRELASECSSELASGGGHHLSKSILASNDFNQGPSHEAEPVRHKDQGRCAANCIRLSVRRMPYLLE